MRMNKVLILSLSALALVCCAKPEPPVPHCEFTDSYVEASSRSARVSFMVDIPEAIDVQNVGLLVSLTDNPSADPEAASKLAKKSVEPVYTFDVSDLEPDTQYWFQPFVLTWDDETEYGDAVPFKTREAKMLDGHEFVNLGLKSGTKWAAFNMDIDSEVGRFAWTDLSNYVSQQWGDKWRMPTKADWQELMDDCFWSWDIQKGRQGMLVKGPNGNSIFLPADGYVTQGHLMQDNEYGAYWTADTADSAPGCSWILFYGMDFVYWYTFPQTYSGSVRPVNNSTFYDYD